MKRLIKRWVAAAILVPAVAWGLGAAADKVAQRRGEDSKAVKGLNLSSRLLRRTR
ncbi:hypothetical protein [Demequina sp.]|uniref:hypothetical protein n=1 Tax=Demequina sp. TaxID=2050685 RepID=UPI0025C4D9A7|nr:hypothetical protein [Demequina sp.]